MTRPNTPEELVAALTDELTAVRPVLAVRQQLVRLGAVCGASALVVVLWLGLHPAEVVARSATSAALCAALGMLGSAGLTFAIALRIPGREGLARWAGGGAAVGIAVLVGLCLAWLGSRADAGTIGQFTHCASRSVLFALPAGLCAGLLALRGAPWRPRVTGFAVAIGAASVGGFLIHLSCPSPSPWHWLLAHALAPLAVGMVLGAGLAAMLARLQRESPRQ